MMGFRRSLIEASALVLVFSVVIGFAADKHQVFVTGGNSFQVAGSGSEASVSGVADSTAAEGIKRFRKKCPAVEVTTRQDKADYIVALTNDGRSVLERGRRVVVSTPEGTIVVANSTRRLKNAVKDACEAITKEWLARPSRAAPVSGPESR